MRCVAFFIAMIEVKKLFDFENRGIRLDGSSIEIEYIYICIYIYMGKVNAMSFN